MHHLAKALTWRYLSRYRTAHAHERSLARQFTRDTLDCPLQVRASVNSLGYVRP